jgi:hypothetical protein
MSPHGWRNLAITLGMSIFKPLSRQVRPCAGDGTSILHAWAISWLQAVAHAMRAHSSKLQPEALAQHCAQHSCSSSITQQFHSMCPLPHVVFPGNLTFPCLMLAVPLTGASADVPAQRGGRVHAASAVPAPALRPQPAAGCGTLLCGRACGHLLLRGLGEASALDVPAAPPNAAGKRSAAEGCQACWEPGRG